MTDEKENDDDELLGQVGDQISGIANRLGSAETTETSKTTETTNTARTSETSETMEAADADSPSDWEPTDTTEMTETTETSEPTKTKEETETQLRRTRSSGYVSIGTVEQSISQMRSLMHLIFGTKSVRSNGNSKMVENCRKTSSSIQR